MRIGFIGAGKMGFTLGKHIKEALNSSSTNEVLKNTTVVGYYSNSLDSAKAAAQFTDTDYYESIENLVDDCDAIFITTPDGQIEVVANIISTILNKKQKEIILIHTSGALSSQVFSGMGNHVYGYSVHPIYAVNSKTESYINFSKAYITIEGNEKHLEDVKELFDVLGHTVKVISAENKTKYHASAVFASNLVVGLYSKATHLLSECGFDEDEAMKALVPLFTNNADNIANKGCKDALTGPVARCDVGTVSKHLDVISGDDQEVYKLLSRELVKIADSGDGKYDSMRGILK